MTDAPSPESAPAHREPARRRVGRRAAFTWLVFGLVLAAGLVELVRSPPPPTRFRTPPDVEFEPFPTRGEGPAAVFGRVVDRAGEPAGDVVVECLVEGRPRWTTTAASGTFRLEGLPPGEHEFRLLAVGRPPTRVAETLPSAGAVLWTLEAPLSELDPVPPVERSPLTGRLASSAGRSGPGCEVVLVPAPGVDPLSGAVPRRTRSGPDGVFRFEDVVHASYVLRALPPWAPGGTWPVLAEVPFDHPLGEPLPVLLEAGRLEVRVLGSDGGAAAGAVVHLSPVGNPGRPWPPRATDDAGRASVGDLPGGTYRVEVGAGAARAERLVDVPADRVVDVDLQLSP